WKLDATTWSQQVEATLLDADGSPIPLPIRFNANLSTANQVAYDPQNCPDMATAHIKTVQDALDHLCIMEHGDGCEVVVGRGGQFETLDGAIAALLQQGRADICICLMPGDHELPNGLTINDTANPPRLRIKIGGC